MKFELLNRTGFPALLRVGGVPPENFSVLKPAPWRHVAQVVVKAVFQLSGGAPIPNDEQAPILERDANTEDGYMEGDLALGKSGLDVIVLGNAHAPRGGPVREMSVEIRVGSRGTSYTVSGERLWTKQTPGWKATDPLPFESMPLGFEQAFGGTFRLSSGAELPFM